MVESRDDLWILNSFTRDRDWLAPKRESRLVWPHMKEDNRVVFLGEDVSAVKAEIIKPIDLMPKDKIGHIRVTSKIAGDVGQVSFNIAVCTSRRLLCELIGPYTELHDVDTELDGRGDECDVWACVAFCSFRFDKTQHYLIGLRQNAVVWEAWTVREEDISTIRMSPRTLRFRINKNVFLFNRSGSMLSEREFDPIFHVAQRLFLFLPDDVARLISTKVHASAYTLPLSLFNGGTSRGVFNYATARLLRVKWLLVNRGRAQRTRSITGLKEYMEMTTESRERVYPDLKSVHRDRHKIFGRTISSKTTRSGKAY